MRIFLKRLLLAFPLPLRIGIVRVRESWWRMVMGVWERSSYRNLPTQTHRRTSIHTVLVYHINGLTHAGTEKNLQLIANALALHYKVFFMYGEKNAEAARSASLDSRITLIPFAYNHNATPVPHRLTGMTPHLKEVIAQHGIDLLITATPGYSHYPWNLITDIPIILLNIFGAPTLQENVRAKLYNSETTKRHAEFWIGPDTQGHVMYAPLFRSPTPSARAAGQLLRKRLSIPPEDFVFGRIGRADDSIFDPIGIYAWRSIAARYPNAHYLIMSPPPALIKIVEQETIPRVHLLPPSSAEEDVWAFHGALNAFAHFRYDGETSGLAIAESLTIGNPVISHESHIWNAHMEYLSPACARIAKKDDHGTYGQYMEEFIRLHAHDREAWDALCTNAKIVSRNFDPVEYAARIQDIVSKIQ